MFNQGFETMQPFHKTMTIFPTLVTLLVSATALCAEEIMTVAPVFSQIVAVPQLDGFQTTFENANASNYIREAVLVGQSVDNWTQMTTLTGAKGLATGGNLSDAMKTAEQLASTYSGACPESLSLAKLETPTIKGATATFAGYLSCGTVGGTDYSESMVFIVMVGTSDIYTIQWAEHGPAKPLPIEYSATPWAERLSKLAQRTQICDRIAGEAAPYPSCFE